MAQIQRGDTRQYFESYIPQVQSENMADVAQASFQGGVQLAQDYNAPKLANYQIDAQNKALELNNQLQIKYQADPKNPQFEADWNQGIDNILKQYSIPIMSQGQWQKSTQQIRNNFRTYNTQWQIQQQQSNAKVDLKNGVQTFIDNAGMLGRSGASIDAVRMSYSNGINSIREPAIQQLGSVIVGDALNSVTSDYMSSYIAGAIDNNPAQALALLKDPGVINDIGNEKQLKTLETAAQSALVNRKKEVAIKGIADNILAKGALGQKIMDGTATTAEIQSFAANATPNQRDIIYAMAGISTSAKFTVDRNTNEINYKKQGGNGLLDLSQLSDEAKSNYIAGLEIRGAELLNFSPEVQKKIKGVKGNDRAAMVGGYLDMVSNYQDEVNLAYASGLINASTAKRMRENYADNVSSFIGNNIKNLHEDSGFLWNNQTGYEALQKEFKKNPKDLSAATITYYNELNRLAKQNGKQNIYELEQFDHNKQTQIYQEAHNKALINARANTENPTYWIERENPSQYAQITNMLNKKDIKKASGILLQEIVKSPEMKYQEQNALTNQIIDGIIKQNQAAAQNKIDSQPVSAQTGLDVRAKALGITMEDVNYTAKKHNMTPQQVITNMEMK